MNKLDLTSIPKPKASDQKVATYYYNKAKDAKNRGIAFNLSLKRVRQLLNTKRCYFTGKILTNSNFSIDRLDANVGYIDSNVVACENNFNTAKSNIDLKGMAAIIRGMQKKKLKLSNEDFEIRIYARKKKK